MVKKIKTNAYVVVETGGKQYRVTEGDHFEVERLSQGLGKEVKLSNVLLYSDDKDVVVGQPFVKDVTVNCQVIDQARAPKVIAFKYKRRKSSKKKIGHRQYFTELLVTDIKK